MTEFNDHNQALIDANRERLHVLELQAATYGNDAPPHIITEISKIVATIRALSTVVDLTPDVDPNVTPDVLKYDQIERRRDASTNEQATLRMIATVQATVAEVSNVKTALRDQVSNIHDQISGVINDISAVKADVREQLDDAKERVNDQIASIEASVANVQTVVLAEVQHVHTTIDRIIKNGLRAIGLAVLILGVVAIGLILYFRV